MHRPPITFYICCSEISTQIVDVWYAKKQASSAADQYRTSFICNYNDKVDSWPEKDVLNIGLGYIFDPKSLDVYNRYDLFFFGNGGEPLEVSGPMQKEILNKPNVYLVSNSLLAPSHEMADKNIWFPDAVMTCCNHWTRHFYPQYFENQNFKTEIA